MRDGSKRLTAENTILNRGPRFKRRSLLLFLLLLFAVCLILSGCGEPKLSTTPEPTEAPTPEPTEYVTPAPTEITKEAMQQIYKKAVENSKAKVDFSIASGFYYEDQSLTLEAEGASAIYYTMDGAVPSYRKTEYTRPIVLHASHADLPKCIVIRAIAYYPDGTKSPVFTQSYFMDSEIVGRFTTLVFSIAGEPQDLTEGPQAIFKGDNVTMHGREYEKEVYLEVFEPDGQCVVAQDLGLRIFGGESRTYAIKSMKLYARKEYDKKNKTIAYNFFDTPRVRGGYIKEYKRLVLRNTSQDFQRAYIRDEFLHTLARRAGYLDTEGVRPVVTYLNGVYYGMHWMHENYCDEYFKEKYGDTEGKYVILEGSEKNKKHRKETDPDYMPEAVAFQNEYERFLTLDLNDDDNYAQVCAFMDVENYLDYFAFNVYVNNTDWPENNYKCYAYFPDDGIYEEGTVRDGRWRFLLHDMDFSFRTMKRDDGTETSPDYNFLRDVANDNNHHYAPLFAKLMEREDCRKYFVDKMYDLIENVFNPENLESVLDEVDASRITEMKFFYVKLDELDREGVDRIWSSYNSVVKETARIKDYNLLRIQHMNQQLVSFQIEQRYKNAEENSKARIAFSVAPGFYHEDQSIALEADDAVAIYYTLDGTAPTYYKTEYTGPIVLQASHSDLPECTVIRAIAYYPDGTKSPVFTQSYFLDTEIDSRFTTLVFSIVGEPTELTDGPDAIFAGDNIFEHGREWEREVYLQVFTETGENVVSQGAGLRIFGNYSRKAAIKSMKLYARKDYDKKNKTIAYNFFDTPRARGGYVKEYKKLVLRNTANDFQFGFIRDEFAQFLARRAGFQDSEGVRPAVVYLNGVYYGLEWLHENYCDDYLKAKYGDSEGEYVILEGSEQSKAHRSKSDEDYMPEAAAFQETYDRLIAMDLRDDEAYAQVRAFMDVENYLDYYALNIYINNQDWPNNNQKLYAYFPEDGVYEEGSVRDGRWRWLPHDMDASMEKVADSYPDIDNLANILSPDHAFYAPMFAKLMEREDCRKYFVDKMNALIEEVFQPDIMLALLDEADQMRAEELKYFYVLLNEMKKEEDSGIWTSYSIVEREMNRIKDFISKRPEYIRQFMAVHLPLDGN